MQSSPHGRLPTEAFASIARSRVKEPTKRAKHAIALFKSNPNVNTLNESTLLTTELVKIISELALENLACSYRTDVLLLLVDCVHRIIDYAKTLEVIKIVGKENVVSVLEKFNNLVDKLISDLDANNLVPKWVHESSLENLRDAFLIRNCQIRGQLTGDERMALYFIYLLKGDLLRYKYNILNQPYIGVLKAYWSSYCFSPQHGNLFQLLAAVTLYRDKDDLLGHVFYVCRAISADIPFEPCSELVKCVLGSVTERLINGDYAKHCKIFENPRLFDSNGYLASNIDLSQPNVWFFSDARDLPIREPKWKRYAARQNRQTLRKMMIDMFFHVMNMTISKLSHEITLSCGNMFICYIEYMLEDEKITGKELVQMVNIFLFGLIKRRDDFHSETMKVTLQVFFTFIGLLLAKIYDFMLIIGDDGFEIAEKRVDMALPALIILCSYWPKISQYLPDELPPLLSHYFDFNQLRFKVMKLGSLLREYLVEFQVEIDKISIDTRDEDAVVFPELIYATLSNQFAGDLFAVRLSNDAFAKDSLTFKTFLMRISMVAELMVQMTEKRFFGLTTCFAPINIPLLSTFELYVTPSLLKTSCYAVYPEYVVIDTNTIIDKYGQISEIIESYVDAYKVIVTPIVMTELSNIAKEDSRKSEQTREAATAALNMITQMIECKCPRLQIYNYYGERKFDFNFSPRDVSGIGASVDPTRKKDTNDDHIIKTCLKLEDISTFKDYGYQSTNIKTRRCVLITDDKIMRINARAMELVSCAFDEFYQWFKKSQNREY